MIRRWSAAVDVVPGRHGTGPADNGTDAYLRYGMEFIRQSAAAKRPFLLFLSLYRP